MGITGKIVTAAALISVSACSASTGASAKPTEAHSSADLRPAASAIIAKFGCINYQPDKQATLLASTTGYCDYNGDASIEVDTFASQAAEQNYKRVADQVGRQARLIYGPLWAVLAGNAQEAAAIQQKTGGTIR